MVTGPWENPVLTPIRRGVSDNFSSKDTTPFAAFDELTAGTTTPQAMPPATEPLPPPVDLKSEKEPKKPGFFSRILQKLRLTSPSSDP
jgi:hypothetical protein